MQPSPSWSVHDPLTKAQTKEFQEAGIEYLHAQLLYNRGIKTPRAMRRFLDARYDEIPDPLSLIDMHQALERIQRALANHEHITVYGDFDADGVTSAALLTRVLRTLKPEAPLDYYIPHRVDEVRGLSKEALDKIKARGTSLVITTDCGSSDAAEVAYARTLGIDIIITDHHRPPEQLPQAYAVINPWRPNSTDSEHYLCGVGIAFKLAQALFRAYDREREAIELLDLVAIGTIGDVAQLLGENHTLVRLGIQQLNHTKNAGLQALTQIANLQLEKLRERDISFALVPRINAAGRMKHAGIAFQLLTTNNDEEARAIAQELEQLNQSRQQQTEELMKLVREQAQSQSNEQVVLVYGDKETWPEGIIGLVAGKLSEEIKRPVFVLSRDTESSRGSARSHGGFNLIEALRERADLFERHGGHAQAAGFTIANTNIEELRKYLQTWHENSTPAAEDAETPDLTGVVTEQEIVAQIEIDTHKVDLLITNPEALNYHAYTRISQLSPFGAGNPEPVFKMNNLRLIRRWPSGPDGRHLQLRLRANHLRFNGTYMRAGDQAESFKEGSLVNVIFCLEPSSNPPEWESGPDTWLKVLHMEVVE